MNLFDFFAPPPPPPPWEAFPGSHGYLRDGQPVVCDRAELERVCAVEPIPRRVWTPDSGGLIGPEEVDSLLRVVRRRLLRRPLRAAAIIALIGGGMVASEARVDGITLGSPAALYLAMVLSLLGMVAHSAWQVARLTPEGFRGMVARERESQRVERRPVRYTPWLAGMMVLCGLIQAVVVFRAGGAAAIAAQGNEFGAMPAAVATYPVVQGGEWWRLLTAAFVHGGPIHFAVNFMALTVLGRDTEMYGGRDLLPVIFLSSILGGTVLTIALPVGLLSALMNGTATAALLSRDSLSVGNSGGLVGLIAFLGVLAWRRPGQVPPGFLNSILVNVGLLVWIGLIGYALIDNAGHAGGGLVGAALGLAFIPTPRRRPVWTTGRGWAIAGIVAMAVLAAGAGLASWLVLRG